MAEGDDWHAGMRFTITGRGFNNWPNDIVLSYNQDYVENDDVPNLHLIRLVSKADTRLVFEVEVDHVWTIARVWRYFASPSERPREVLPYSII